MAKVLLYSYFLLTVFFTACEALNTLVVNKIELCPIENPPDVDIELFTNNKNEKALNMRAFYGYDIDESYKLEVRILNLQNEEWKQVFIDNRKWCEVIETLKQPWSTIKAAIQPPIVSRCLIPAGEYKLDGVHVNEDEIAFYANTLDENSYKGNILLYTDDYGNTENILCATVDFDIKQM